MQNEVDKIIDSYKNSFNQYMNIIEKQKEKIIDEKKKKEIDDFLKQKEEINKNKTIKGIVDLTNV